jgi:outer membrane protein TolC
MVKNLCICCLIFLLSVLCTFNTYSQTTILTLKEAINIAIKNYGTLKAKSGYVRASSALVAQSRKEYLPDLNLSMQQDYGTINGQNGILYGYRGLSASPSGPPMDRQNWNAAFGSLYLANINWDFFAFGKARERVQVATAAVKQDEADLEQEKFQHQVRVAAAYLNLLAAQRITLSQQKNLDRAKALATVVTARARNGLNAGVDSSQSNAEVSNAKILLTRAIDEEQEQSNQLSILLGTTSTEFTLDTVFITRIPATIDTSLQIKEEDHPLLKYYRSRVDLSNARGKYYNTFKYPTFSAFSVVQARGSGFNYNYNSLNMDGYTKSYAEGVKPTRGNYLIGIGMIWNLSGYLKINQQVESQRFISQGLREEYEVVDQRLKNEMMLAGTKIKNALQNFYEVPVEVKAASDAYLQKSVLYKNGLTGIIDVTQALYALNRAETDRDISYNNVWQALLYKAAASGDFDIFIKEF